MFFSTDLLANKSGPFSRIWLLGCGSEKVKGQDNKTNIIKLIKLVQEWIQRQDAKRLSLFLSSTLAYGMVRIVRNQVATLRRDVGNAKLDLAKSLRLAQTLNEPIDMEVPNIDLDLPEPELLNRTEKLFDETTGEVGNRSAITMREPALPLPGEQDNFGEDFGFGEEPTNLSNRRDLFDEDIFARPEEEQPETDDHLEKLDGIDPAAQVAMENTEINDPNAEDGAANAPPRATPPQNGNRENSPPPFPEMTIIEPEQPEVSVQPEPEISVQAEPEVEMIPPEPMETDEAQPGQIPDSIITSPVRAREPSIVEPVVESPAAAVDTPMELNSLDSAEIGKKRKAKPKKARKTKCLKVDNTVQLNQEIMRTNRENTRDIINENLWNKPDQRSVKDLLFESFGRPIMAKGLQDGLRAAAYDEKYGDFEFEEEEQNQQENPEMIMEENETANESDVLRRNEDSSLNEEHTHFGSLDQGRSRAGVTDPFLQLPSVRGSLDMIGQNEATLDHAENDVHQDISEQPPLNLTPEELQEPRLDDIQEERSSQIAPGEIPVVETIENEQIVEEPSEPTPPPAFDSNDILRVLDEGGNEFINLTEKMGLESRRGCALAFSNVLQMVKEGKISCEQEEYFGPIMVRKI